MTRHRWRRLAPLLFAGLAGCAVGPDYERPSAPTTPNFKEEQGWVRANPRPAASDDAWWSVYDDTVLDGLERQVAVSNETLKADEAAYRQALAAVDAASASFFPTVSLGASGTRTGSGGTGSSSETTSKGLSGSQVRNEFSLTGQASWVPDIWGKIRRTVESADAKAAASADDLAAARLSLQATLATDYFTLRQYDDQRALLDRTIADYDRSLTITRNQYAAGIVTKTDVIQAETQLRSAQSQRIGLDAERAALEHAVAVLTGKAPAEVAIEIGHLADAVPETPAGLPSALIERRPDVAAAERQVASANAEIGVAIGAFFPDLTLSASGSLSSNKIGQLLKVSNGVWSVGASLAETVFDAGARSAAVEEARAGYDQTVATYRQTVLTAFQQVEDALANLRILADQEKVQRATASSAEEAVALTLNQYKAGTVSYTTVVTAAATALSAEQTLLTIRANRLNASASLITALGGGWQPAAP